MLKILKDNSQYIIYLILFIILGYTYQSSSSKYKLLEQQKKIEIEKIITEKNELSLKILTMEKNQIKLENSLKKAQKQVHTIIKKSADGSYTKEILSTQNSEQSNNIIQQNNEKIKQEDLKLNNELMQKESLKVEEKSKLETKETSRNNNLLLIILGVGACLITQICAF